VERLREAIGRLLLRSPVAPRPLRRLPLLGPPLGRLLDRLLPRHERQWVQVARGPARGIWLHLNPRVGAALARGAIEPEVQQALLEHLPAGGVFWDVGANLGFFTLLAARRVGPSGRVVAFEPDPDNAALLRAHVARNGFDALVEVIEAAAWSEPGTVAFRRNRLEESLDRGSGCVVGAAMAAAEVVAVQAISLDACLGRGRLPDVIKCDVEGAEARVLAGARRLLAVQRPVLIIEWHSAESREQVRAELAALDYRCDRLGERHLLARP
jgi:FkbM family methyltransferase